MTSSRPSEYHHPVLLEAVLDAAAGAVRVVDATLGGGGHASPLRAGGATVLGIDRDPGAVAEARRLMGDAGITYLNLPYSDPGALRAVSDFHPDFVLLDLGISSRQLDDDSRGFTFRPGVRLDMRMGAEGSTAAELLNDASEADLRRLFGDYGDEPRAARLAREVVRRRANAAFLLSDDFVNAIRAVLGPRAGPDEFARLFQALRIAVNDELTGLSLALPGLREALTPGGRLAVISYHSGEDRIVKHLFREWARACICPPAFPMCTCRGHPLGRVLTLRAITPEVAEAVRNPRARSARLRIFQVANER